MDIIELGRAPARSGLGGLAVFLMVVALGAPLVQASEMLETASEVAAALEDLSTLEPAAGDPSAQEDPEAARRFLQGFGDEAVALLSAGGMTPQQRKATFRGLIRSGFEIDTIGRLVLGRHWKTANEAQRAEYTELFESYVVVTTVKRLSDFTGDVLTVGAARPASDAGLVTIGSSILRRNGTKVVLDWRLRQSEGAWRVIDLVVEGVSMLQTQRAEFDAVIRQNGAGLDGLLRQLRSLTRA